MEFIFSENHIKIKNLVREFCKKEFKINNLLHYDKTGTVPKELYKKLGEFKLPGGGTLLSPTIPKKYGGAGRDSITAGIITEELGRVNGVILAYLFEVIGVLLVKYAPDHIKSKWVPALCKGEKIIAIALTEYGTGTYPAKMKTRAIKIGSHYVINGIKNFITFGAPGVADAILLFAKTAPQKGSHGISCFFIESDAPGINRIAIKNSLGHRAAGWGHIIIKNLEVSKENIIGKENEALLMFFNIWNYDRVLASLLCLGMAEASFENLMKYYIKRENIPEYVKFVLAEDATLIDAAKLLAYRALWKRDNNLEFIKDAAMAKWYSIDVAQKVVDDCLQFYGAIGYTSNVPIEHRFREIRGFKLAAGSSEAMKIIIFKSLMKDFYQKF